MAHVLSPKRTWIFLLPLLVHGVAAAIGGLVWFVFSLHALLDETASARHIFRRPSPTEVAEGDRKSTRLNSSHSTLSRMPSSA